jgi:N-acetyl-gamma-glutamyl-phosphate reductase
MGAELLRLLSAHPKVQLTAVTSERLAGERLDKVFPHFRSLSSLTFQEVDAERLAAEADVVFLALPHMESQRAVPVLRRHGRKVVDLSADYRLRDGSLYTTWYKAPHIDPAGLAEAVYGLPELHRKAIAQASLVASPGCYPMGAILATAPLMKSGIGAREGIVVDGKSGVTGAGAQGRKIDPMYLYTEAPSSTRGSRSCACCPRASGPRPGTSWARTSATSPWWSIRAPGARCACPRWTISARAVRPTASRA